MVLPEIRRRLIVTADDFGSSSDVNAAVIRAHREGILTCASLMVGGPAFEEAVELARAHPTLGVGLHLTLCCGKSVLPGEAIPDLVDGDGCFRDDPARAGLVYFFHSPARRQARLEVEAQFKRFAATGLPLDHVNGHLHIHLHPVVLGWLRKLATRYRVRSVRLTREPWERHLVEEGGRWAYRLGHAAVFSGLSGWAQPRLAAEGIAFADTVFGLLQNGLMNEAYLERLLRDLPPGVTEIYSHPSLSGERVEFEALISTRLAHLVRAERIDLIRYEDIWPGR